MATTMPATTTTTATITTTTTHSMSTDTQTATTIPTTSTSPSTSTTTPEDSTMDTNEEPQAPDITREARAKASKDCLKALLVLRTPRLAETAPSNTQQGS